MKKEVGNELARMAIRQAAKRQALVDKLID